MKVGLCTRYAGVPTGRGLRRRVHNWNFERGLKIVALALYLPYLKNKFDRFWCGHPLDITIHPGWPPSYI